MDNNYTKLNSEFIDKWANEGWEWGQLQAGFILTDIFEDINGQGRLHDFNIPTFYATRAVKK